MHQRVGEQHAEQGRQQPDADREPHPVDPLGERAAQVPGTEVAGDAGGGAVGQEDAQADRGLQDGAGDAEARQRCRAEVADDRRVGQQEQRLGDQREEGGDSQPPDLAVRGGAHGHTLVTVRTRT